MLGAVSKVVGALQGQALPFELGAEVATYIKSPWRLHTGKKDGADVSIFMYDTKKGSELQLSLVRNAMKRMRVLKHPYLLKCIDAGELADGKGAGTVYMVTEPVVPLEDVLEELRQTPYALVWGAYTLAAAVNFLGVDGKMVHGLVTPASIFVDRGSDWKLGGFELIADVSSLDAGYFSRAKEILPKQYQSPELARGQSDVLNRIPVAADWWALGCTLFEIFCSPIRSPADLKNIADMPAPLRDGYKGLLSANPGSRLRPAELLQNPLFEDDYVSLHLFLEMLNVKVPTPRAAPPPAPRVTRACASLTGRRREGPLLLKAHRPRRRDAQGGRDGQGAAGARQRARVRRRVGEGARAAASDRLDPHR